MSEQHYATSSQNDHVPWWIRLCRWLWKYPLPFLLSTLIINIAINIISAWLITSSNTNPISDTSPFEHIAGWIGTHWLYSLLLGTISIALLLVTWLGSRWPVLTPSVSNQVSMSTQNRERMLRRLRLRYEQLFSQSLQGAVQIELGLTFRPAAIQNALSLLLHLPEQPEQALPAHTSIVDAYEQTQQELLILGEPGAGKSTLLLELAQHLVEQAEKNADQPLPVLLPLSSWAVKRPALQDWLIEQVKVRYDISRQLSQDWVRADLLLPLLDGLDEMDEAARACCIGVINIYHREHLHPLVICSRTNEYDAATVHERLALHTAVVVQPLTLKQIDAHLATIGKPLTALRMTMKKNATLQTLATTPLLLQILILTYHDIPVRSLSYKEGQLREQIWSDYVQQMVSRKGDSKCYPLEQTRAWLKWLAREMRLQNQTIFSLEQLQLDCLPKTQRVLYQWSTGLVFGLLFGLGSGLGKTIEPAEALAWSWKDLRDGLLTGLRTGLLAGLRTGLIFGLIFGLVGGLIFDLGNDLLFGLEMGLIFGLAGGLIFGLLAWLIRGLLTSLRFGLRFGLLFGIANGLFFGLEIGLIRGLLVGLVSGLATGMISGLIRGLLVGLASGLSRTQLTERLMLSPNEGIRPGF